MTAKYYGMFNVFDSQLPACFSTPFMYFRQTIINMDPTKYNQAEQEQIRLLIEQKQVCYDN